MCEANRRNAAKSTGAMTKAGKQRSDLLRTCGGPYFAGHGAYVKSGSATSQMNSFSLQ
jgi:hypothetical protein